MISGRHLPQRCLVTLRYSQVPSPRPEAPGSEAHRVALISGRHPPRSYFVIHRYLKLTEVPLLLCGVPTLDFCLGEQRSSSREVKGTSRAASPQPEDLHYYLMHFFIQVVLQTSISTQISQLILYISNRKG